MAFDFSVFPTFAAAKVVFVEPFGQYRLFAE